MGFRVVPQEVAGSVEHRICIVARIAVFVDPIARISLRTPTMAQCRLIAGRVVIVQKNIGLGERVVIGSHVTSELHQGRVSVSARDVAEHLVIGSVFLDDVEDVADGRWLARSHRNGMRSSRLFRWRPIGAVIRHHLLGKRL